MRKKQITLLAIVLGAVVGGLIGVLIGYSIPRPTTYINYSCAVYSDRSMCCSPLDYSGGVAWYFKPPCLVNVTNYLKCKYSLVNFTFYDCKEVLNQEEQDENHA